MLSQEDIIEGLEDDPSLEYIDFLTNKPEYLLIGFKYLVSSYVPDYKNKLLNYILRLCSVSYTDLLPVIIKIFPPIVNDLFVISLLSSDYGLARNFYNKYEIKIPASVLVEIMVLTDASSYYFFEYLNHSILGLHRENSVPIFNHDSGLGVSNLTRVTIGKEVAQYLIEQYPGNVILDSNHFLTFVDTIEATPKLFDKSIPVELVNIIIKYLS